MADAVKALTHWRRGRDLVKSEHTREVVRQELPDTAKAALMKIAYALEAERAEREADRVRIKNLELVIARLAVLASQET